ncbi:hypothetical protein GOP47_0004765 [Adiantum capillus-veneris]|uniref:Uncharacterized protein n=1 Tax=Adiantum capillus-veneris TaxID=13818 RepID=A0A9D4ZN04_ADICA|nr:hypothetical protein GOP47_0004765 [Adiantum capillus-veneris]
MAALTSALTALGADVSSSNIRDEVDRLQKEVTDLEASASMCVQQINFCESMLEQVLVDPPASTAAFEPQPSKSSPKEDATVDDVEAIAQEGVDAVQRMVVGDENPDSPIFLSDMVKLTKKRRKNGDGKPSKKNRPSESTRSKQHAHHADGDMGEREAPRSPPAMKKTPRKSTPLHNPSSVSHPPKPRVCKKL